MKKEKFVHCIQYFTFTVRNGGGGGRVVKVKEGVSFGEIVKVLTKKSLQRRINFRYVKTL